jgi:mannose-6-phosphate isomerase-like protein (cupin superfamily)
MHHRAATLLAIVAVFLAFPPAHMLGQDAEDATAATMIMADDLEFAPIEVPGFDSGMEIAGMFGDFTMAGPYALRLSFPDGYRFPAHFHPMDENLTVISGTFLLAMGDWVDESQLVSYGPGDFMNLPAEHPHYGGAKGFTVIQLHGDGPFEILLVEETAATDGS